MDQSILCLFLVFRQTKICSRLVDSFRTITHHLKIKIKIKNINNIRERLVTPDNHFFAYFSLYFFPIIVNILLDNFLKISLKLYKKT